MKTKNRLLILAVFCIITVQLPVTAHIRTDDWIDSICTAELGREHTQFDWCVDRHKRRRESIHEDIERHRTGITEYLEYVRKYPDWVAYYRYFNFDRKRIEEIKKKVNAAARNYSTETDLERLRFYWENLGGVKCIIGRYNMVHFLLDQEIPDITYESMGRQSPRADYSCGVFKDTTELDIFRAFGFASTYFDIPDHDRFIEKIRDEPVLRFRFEVSKMRQNSLHASDSSSIYFIDKYLDLNDEYRKLIYSIYGYIINYIMRPMHEKHTLILRLEKKTELTEKDEKVLEEVNRYFTENNNFTCEFLPFVVEMDRKHDNSRYGMRKRLLEYVQTITGNCD
ncbi:hypothetical protein QA601_18540 [Chitinispirillales bacterium ANBcel5]|uniref:hypothetical protein n=1 Tax=Cellulosispirillum alkaliphilum TaxID=3039283 RepID=UPI002A537CA9|nr:hypothetical protein [Chitinispirillales bacterium ANBcel5]